MLLHRREGAHEMQALETLIKHIQTAVSCVLPLSDNTGLKKSSYTHTTNASAQLVCGLERSSWAFEWNEHHTHRCRCSARPSRSQTLALCFFGFLFRWLFFNYVLFFPVSAKAKSSCECVLLLLTWRHYAIWHKLLNCVGKRKHKVCLCEK